MDVSPDAEKQCAEQPIRNPPYISEEAMRPLARMIARRLLTEEKYVVGISGNVQPDTQLKTPEESLADDKEGDH